MSIQYMKTEEVLKDTQLYTRLSDKEEQAINKLVKISKKSKSTFIRDALLEVLIRENMLID